MPGDTWVGTVKGTGTCGDGGSECHGRENWQQAAPGKAERAGLRKRSQSSDTGGRGGTVGVPVVKVPEVLCSGS